MGNVTRILLTAREGAALPSPLKVIRPKRLAKMLDIHPCTVSAWIANGTLPPKTKFGQGIEGWTEEQIRDWMVSRETK